MHKAYADVRSLAAFFLYVALSGCAGNTVGEALESESAGSRLSAGEKMMLDGQALIAEGQEDINDGKTMQREGENKVAKGHALISNGQMMQRAAAPSTAMP